jgi:predicted Ser/Thr protein kinase
VEPGTLGGLCPACLLKQGAAADTFQGSTPFEPPAIEHLAAILPGLELIEFIGRGGMGAVYKARQRQLDRLVALKVLPAAMGGDPAFADRFAREARALALLNHPNIVTIHDFGQADGLFYLLMEYVDGMTLRQLLAAGRVAPREALAIVPQVCDALQFAHDHGIVHRDIKPENVLMDRRGRVKVADFGIAKLMMAGPEPANADSGGPGTEAGKVLGTPSYMAPEQAEHPEEVDHRADIFALGVVFYQMLTGELPARNAEAPSRKVSIDVRLDEVVLRALERNPALRYAQASAFKTEVETLSQAGGPAIPACYVGYEYKSKREWFGLPLLHVAAGLDPRTMRKRHARGIVAVGDRATGWVALGGSATGIIAFGGIAFGGIAIGGIAAGVLCFGGLAAALFIALGGVAVGTVATGGLAVGYLAAGGMVLGIHMAGPQHNDPAARWLLEGRFVYNTYIMLWALWAVLFAATSWLMFWARKRSFPARNATS